MADGKVLIRRPNSTSTPPNCAICLGSCTNKCFSDSCMHQFCFQCLLEWSRIKAECPLCKQPFQSIIHNVISNEEFDEHVVEAPRNDDVRLLGNEDMWFLPLPLTPHRHEFHVRTTFTVDSRGEHAIQQMLLTHPLTTGGRITVGTGYPRGVYPSRHRRDFSATSFRRSIYAQNLWVYAQPDLTGRYRECSPAYFRSNPAGRQRLAPWLNRELNALLYENTQLIMHLVDLIMDNLLTHHICSRTFRNLLREYFNTKTDHFVHEFYNFMRSPFDMIGYDRSVIYTSRPQSPAPFLEDDTVEIPDDNSDDSDVVLVSASNPTEPVTISLIESNSDSDEPVMVSSSSPVPMPLPPPAPRSLTPEPLTRPSSPVTLVNLPPKLRHKHKALQEKEKHRWTKKRRYRSRSNSSSSSSSSDDREKESYKKYRRRKMMKKLKQKKVVSHIDSSDTTTEVNITSSGSDTNENKLSFDIIRQKRKQKKKSRKDKKRRESRHEDSFRVRERPKIENSTQMFPMDLTLASPSCSRHSDGSSSLPNNRYPLEHPKTKSTVEFSNNGQYTSVQIETTNGLADNTYLDEPSLPKTKIRIVNHGHNSPQHCRENRDHDEAASSGDLDQSYPVPSVKSEIREVKEENPGPSTSKPIPLVLKREHNKWYVFGDSDSSD